MKKNNQNQKIFNLDFPLKKDLDESKIKTTNVNILLNRVRLDRKRTFRKRIFFSFFLISIISAISIFFLIK